MERQARWGWVSQAATELSSCLTGDQHLFDSSVNKGLPSQKCHQLKRHCTARGAGDQSTLSTVETVIFLLLLKQIVIHIQVIYLTSQPKPTILHINLLNSEPEENPGDRFSLEISNNLQNSSMELNILASLHAEEQN